MHRKAAGALAVRCPNQPLTLRLYIGYGAQLQWHEKVLALVYFAGPGLLVLQFIVQNTGKRREYAERNQVGRDDS